MFQIGTEPKPTPEIIPTAAYIAEGLSEATRDMIIACGKINLIATDMEGRPGQSAKALDAIGLPTDEFDGTLSDHITLIRDQLGKLEEANRLIEAYAGTMPQTKRLVVAGGAVVHIVARQP